MTGLGLRLKQLLQGSHNGLAHLIETLQVILLMRIGCKNLCKLGLPFDICEEEILLQFIQGILAETAIQT
ncbi:Uncharacterised protein [Chlamydia trachomatis]|nr:Uncharacterised protein [Chlamydia trachomatis]